MTLTKLATACASPLLKSSRKPRWQKACGAKIVRVPLENCQLASTQSFGIVPSTTVQSQAGTTSGKCIPSAIRDSKSGPRIQNVACGQPDAISTANTLWASADDFCNSFSLIFMVSNQYVNDRQSPKAEVHWHYDLATFYKRINRYATAMSLTLLTYEIRVKSGAAWFVGK